MARARMLSTYPEVAGFWHPVLNGELTPERVEARSELVVWWRCPKIEAHEWRTKVRSRVTTLWKVKNQDRDSFGCPFCVENNPRASVTRNLASEHGTLANSWHPTRNGTLTASDVTPRSRKQAWWICDVCSHEWRARVDARVEGHGCPACRSSSVCKKYGRIVSNRVFSYKYQAKRRKLEWSLEDDQAVALLRSPCFFCGHLRQPFNGIDRLDNDRGYVEDNVVSCCSTCNHAKCKMSVSDFQAWLDRLAKHQGYSKSRNDAPRS